MDYLNSFGFASHTESKRHLRVILRYFLNIFQNQCTSTPAQIVGSKDAGSVVADQDRERKYRMGRWFVRSGVMGWIVRKFNSGVLGPGRVIGLWLVVIEKSFDNQGLSELLRKPSTSKMLSKNSITIVPISGKF